MTAARALIENSRLRVALFTLAVVVIYLPALHGQFILDDSLYIAENERVHSLGNIFSLFVNIQGPLSHRPLVLASFALNYALDGLNTTGYHAVNILLHLCVGLLLYELLRATAQRLNAIGITSQIVSFAAVLLFLVHPIQTESVSYITSRSVLLVSVFYLSAMLLYIHMVEKGASVKTYAFMFVIGLFAGASRENFITISAMLPLYDYLFLSGRDIRRTLRNLRFMLPLLPGIAYMLWMMSITDAYNHTVGPRIAEVTPWMYFMTQWKVHWLYVRLLFFPVGQTLEYDVHFVESFSLSLLPYAAFYFGLWGGALWLMRRNVAGFGLLWFMVTLTPTSSIVPIVDAVFEHRLYIPSMGFFTFLSLMTVPFIAHFERRLRNSVVLVLLLLTVLLCGATYARNTLWSNTLLMDQDAVRKAPRKFRPLFNLATEEYKLGDYDLAITLFYEAMQANPDDAITHYYLAMSDLNVGNLPEAQEHFRMYVRLQPDTKEADQALYNIALIDLDTGHTQEAVASFEEAIAHNPHNAAAHNNLAVALNKLGRRAEAIRHYRQSLFIDPKHPTTLLNLGQMLMEDGNIVEGEALLIRYSLTQEGRAAQEKE